MFHEKQVSLYAKLAHNSSLDVILNSKHYEKLIAVNLT